MVFLVGYMGSGKSTMGRRLARHLGWVFIDLDERIVQKTGMPVHRFFEEHGETAFRTLERDTLRSLDLSRPSVIATGGGTPCFHANMHWMNAHGKTIYLEMGSKALWQRLRNSDVSLRPVLQDLEGEKLLRFIEAKLAERLPFYQQAQFAVNPLRDKVKEIAEKCICPRPHK